MEFTVFDDNNVKINLQVVDMFKDEGNNINYIIYTDGTTNNDGQLACYASRFEIKDNQLFLKDIKSDYEWDLMDNILVKE